MPVPRSRLLAILALVTVLAAFPLGALAIHDFADVPDSNLFHADISALAASGVTTGCGGGNYCPSAFVTREQMAAFMNRLGALAAGKTPVVNADKLDGLDSTDLLGSDALFPGTASCAGTALFPVFNVVNYGETGGARAGDDAHYACGLAFPNGALVTSFTGTFFDDLASEETFCNLYGKRLDDASTIALMGATTSTGISAVPGLVELTDSTIDSATIDNASYAYFADCWLGGNSGSLTVGAVRAAYTAAP